MFLRPFVVMGVLAAITTLNGCRGTEALDTETAMALLKERNMDPVKFTFSATPPQAPADARLVQAYDKLIDAHVLNCTATQPLGKLCQPGPAGEALSVVGATELALNAGHWVPSSVSKISREGSGSSIAEVRMSFEPSPLYRDFESTFDDIQSLGGRPGAESLRDGKTVRATFQHAEDGWHLTGLD